MLNVQQTYYEWAVEVLDKNGDIYFTSYFERLPDAAKFITPEDTVQLAFMRDIVDEDTVDRQYAYIHGNVLPSRFDDGALVPRWAHDVLADCIGLFDRQLDKLT